MIRDFRMHSHLSKLIAAKWSVAFRLQGWHHDALLFGPVAQSFLDADFRKRVAALLAEVSNR
jgi:hypothetical protein